MSHSKKYRSFWRRGPWARISGQWQTLSSVFTNPEVSRCDWSVLPRPQSLGQHGVLVSHLSLMTVSALSIHTRRETHIIATQFLHQHCTMYCTCTSLQYNSAGTCTCVASSNTKRGSPMAYQRNFHYFIIKDNTDNQKNIRTQHPKCNTDS